MQPAVICNNSDIKVPREQCAAGDNESKQDMTYVWRERPIPSNLRSLSPPSTLTPVKMETIHLFSPSPASTQPSPHSTNSPCHLPRPPTPSPLYCHANPVTTLLISLSCHSSLRRLKSQLQCFSLCTNTFTEQTVHFNLVFKFMAVCNLRFPWV